MSKLLRANFSRLWKDKVFWLGMLFMFGLGSFIVYTMYSDMVRYDEWRPLDHMLLIYVEYIGCCAAIFCSLFTGTEYSDGTIRNKLSVGHLRSSIYLSNWVTSVAAVVLMAAAFLISYCTLGSFFLGGIKVPIGVIFFHIFLSIFNMAAYVSLFHMLSMLISKKSNGAVICMLAILGLMMLALVVKARLEAPEFTSGYVFSANGTGLDQAAPEPNPRYLQPAQRKAYEFFMDVLPSGQSLQIAVYEVVHPVLIVLYSTIVSAAATIFGIFAFRKKNLK